MDVAVVVVVVVFIVVVYLNLLLLLFLDFITCVFGVDFLIISYIW